MTNPSGEAKENIAKRSGTTGSWRISTRGTLRMKQSGSTALFGYAFADSSSIAAPTRQLKSIYKKIEGLQTSIGFFKKEMTKNSTASLLGANRDRFEDNDLPG